MYRTYSRHCARVFRRSLATTNALHHVQLCKSYVERIRRLQLLRSDDELCRQTMIDAGFIVYAQRRPLMKCENGHYSFLFNKYDDVRPYFTDDEHLINRSFLINIGADSRPHFVLTLPDAPESLAEDFKKRVGGVYMLIREAFYTLPRHQSIVTTQGDGLLAWDSEVRFCPRCGHSLHRNVSGSQKKCRSCKQVQYPKTSPVVSTLVSNETNTACVLTYKPRVYMTMHTIITGFMEIGESIEDAVSREVAEEVGLEIKSQRYLSSQYWTGSSNALMIGCLAVATEAELTIDRKELQDARWFTVDEVRQGLENTDGFDNYFTFSHNKENKLLFMPRNTIDYALMQEWMKQTKS